MSTNRFSIRSYSKQIRSHFHHYHQLVLPLHGVIEIQVGNFTGHVSQGDCIVIKSGQQHAFKAEEHARFLVVDLDNLPDNIIALEQETLLISSSLKHFILFIENQLNKQVNTDIETASFQLFHLLLAQQSVTRKIDKRISKAIRLISADLSINIAINDLAKQACLSATQFKKVFKESTGVTSQQYLTNLRMEKAKALLTYTDTPINIIAEQVGYLTPSAFSRKFKEHFADSPSAFKHSN